MLSNCHFATLTNETHWNATAGEGFPKTDAKPDQIMFPKLCLFKNIAFLKTPPCPTPAPSENVSWVLKPRVGYRPHRGYTINIDKQAKIFNKRQAALLVYLTSKEENWWPQQSAKPPPRKRHTSSNCESLALHTYPFLAHHWKFLKKRHNENMKRFFQVLDVDNCCYKREWIFLQARQLQVTRTGGGGEVDNANLKCVLNLKGRKATMKPMLLLLWTWFIS